MKDPPKARSPNGLHGLTPYKLLLLGFDIHIMGGTMSIDVRPRFAVCHCDMLTESAHQSKVDQRSSLFERAFSPVTKSVQHLDGIADLFVALENLRKYLCASLPKQRLLLTSF